MIENFEAMNLGTRHRFISKDGRYIYHIGIIDYLQLFDLTKMGETAIKVVRGKDWKKISSAEPKFYA